MSIQHPTNDPALPPAGRRFGMIRKPRGALFAGLGGALSRRPQRPVVLALAAAVIGLGLAGAGLIRPAERDMTSVPPGDVALVNQEPILMSDFITEAENALGMPFADTTPAQRAGVLRAMIDQELLVQRSLALDLPEQDTDVRSALIDGVLAQVNAGVLEATPTDDDLRAYFNVNRAKYASGGSMNLTDIVMHVGGFENTAQTVDQAMADAKQAVYELRSGTTLDYAKQHFGFVDSGKVNGEEEDFAAKIHLGAKLYAVAQGMTDGDISEPVADTDGVHVLVMQGRRKPVFADFDAVRNNVYTDYMKAKQNQAEAEHLKFLRANAQILLSPGQRE
jgi:hypothetical protein